MNRDEFNNHVERIFNNCKDILTTKGEDYSYADEDRLSNFKETGKEIGQSPFTIWYVYFNKGLSSIRRYINKGKVESENIHARIQDAINYLILLDALITEKEDFEFDEHIGIGESDPVDVVKHPVRSMKVEVPYPGSEGVWFAYIGRAVYHYVHPNDDPTYRVPAVIVAIDDHRMCVDLKYSQTNRIVTGIKLKMVEPINAEDHSQEIQINKEENRATSI